MDEEYKLIKEFSFRELNNKFVQLKNYSDITLKCIHKYKNSKISFFAQHDTFAYFYIDYEKGLMMDLIGNVTTGMPLTEDNIFSFSYKEIEDTRAFFKIALDAPVLEYKKIYDKYLEKTFEAPHMKNIIKTRELEWLDLYRDKYKPDCLNVLYRKNSREQENLIVKIYDYDEKNHILKAKLLTTSFLNSNLKVESIVSLGLLGNKLSILEIII